MIPNTTQATQIPSPEAISQFLSNIPQSSQASISKTAPAVTQIPTKSTAIHLEKIQQSLTTIPTLPAPNETLLAKNDKTNNSNLPTNVLLTIAFYSGQSVKKDTKSAQLSITQSNTDQTIKANKQQQEALQDSYDQMAKSQKWQKAQKVFSALTMVIGAVVLVSTIATGGLASAAFLAVGALITVGLMIDSNHGSPVMGAVTDFMTNIATKVVGVSADFLSAITGGKIDMSEETQEKLSNLLGQVMTGLLVMSAMLLTTVGGIKTMKNKAIMTPNGQKPFMQIFAQTIRKVGKILEGTFRISSSATKIGASVYNYKGTVDQIRSQEWGAFLKAIEDYSGAITDSLESIIDSIEEQNQTLLNMLKELSQTDSSLYNNLSKSV